MKCFTMLQCVLAFSNISLTRNKSCHDTQDAPSMETTFTASRVSITKTVVNSININKLHQLYTVTIIQLMKKLLWSSTTSCSKPFITLLKWQKSIFVPGKKGKNSTGIAMRSAFRLLSLALLQTTCLWTCRSFALIFYVLFSYFLNNYSRVIAITTWSIICEFSSIRWVSDAIFQYPLVHDRDRPHFCATPWPSYQKVCHVTTWEH